MRTPTREVVEIPVISDAVRRIGAPLSPVVRAGDLLFVSGLPPMDISTGAMRAGDIVEQTRACLELLEFVLGHAGSSLEQVVRTTVYVANAAHFARVNAVYAEFFTTDPPARTFVPVGSWPLDFDIEIECVALHSGAR